MRIFYKSENKYLNKFIGELQVDMEQKESKKDADGIPELKKKDSLKLSDSDGHDELIESERVNHGESADNFIGPEFLHKSDLLIDESSSSSSSSSSEDDEELEETGKADDGDDLEGSSSSSSDASENGERKRLASEIKDIEKELQAEKDKQKNLGKAIADLEEERKKIKEETSTSEGESTKSTGALTAQIRESEAELEALNAHIYELEADLEHLLDELWDYEQSKHANKQVREDKEDLEDNVESSEDEFYNSTSNREHLSTRIIELEKELEELEDELEETMASSKNQREALINKNQQLQGKLEATIEKAKKEHFNLAVRYNELEKLLQATIERGRSEQKALAIHYIEKERELKQTSSKARAEEKRLNGIIKKLEKQIESNQGASNHEDGFLSKELAIILEDVENNEKVDSNKSNDAKEQGKGTDESQRKNEELLLAKVSKLKEEYDSSLVQIKVLNESITDIEDKLQSSQTIVCKAEQQVKDLNESYAELETKWKCVDEDHECAIWEAEQKMRDLMDTASLEKKEKNRFRDQCLSHKKEIETLKGENEKLMSHNEMLEAAENNGRDTLVRRVAELEEEVHCLSIDNDFEVENMMKRIQDLQEELMICKRQNRCFSSQIDCYEEERKNHSKMTERLAALELELQCALEESKAEKQIHSELKVRLIETTVKNQIEKTNLDKLLRKLQMELESTTRELQSTQVKNQSLANDLKFFESEKDRLNQSDVDYIEEDLRSTLEENENIFQKMQSYERGTSSKSMLSQSTPLKQEDRNLSPTTPGSKDRTVTENTYIDEDTLTSDAESDGARSGGDADSLSGVSGRGGGVTSSISDHNSILTTKVANGIANGTIGSPTYPSFEPIDAESTPKASGSGSGGGAFAMPFEPAEEEETDGMTNPQTAPTEEQSRKIVEYLTPLIERADKILGQEVPLGVVQGIQDLLATRADEVECENFTWEDFELLLEDVCHDYDEDAWFEIQEAFFVAWEETEIQKMGGDLSEGQDNDDDKNNNDDNDKNNNETLYDQ